jgi:hypothetical protein
MTTSASLYNIFNNGGYITNGILHDLFGITNWPQEVRNNENKLKETITMYQGIYKGLWLMEVSINEIENAQKKNELDKLIITKYKGRSSIYFDEYCKTNCKIGKTFYNYKK